VLLKILKRKEMLKKWIILSNFIFTIFLNPNTIIIQNKDRMFIL